MIRKEQAKVKLKMALWELVIRERQYNVAKRGLIKVMRIIAKLEEQIEKANLA